ncbi:hypothetical protein MKW92_000164, partial [Papaver armeniacum]
MPLRRYEIRNEYALADPQLYKHPPNLKDDPEALLEAVAMAGLVGLLRQLGDLAEFASEIFHDLHEEVMTTSARGHGLMTRLQQIEADVPLVERGLLSQTSHSQFLHNGGVDWHTNFRMDQNQITRGDLPRFIMDSYEECRGPPRLFLLDKFDTAGAGACLKRYSDPSFYKSFSETTQTEGQSEKRARKFKRKSAYRKYGETPGSTPTSHPKLHELLSEDKIQTQNGTRLHHVRLKSRPSSSSLLNSPTGKSYMEKYLDSVSPLSKPPYESPLQLEMAPKVHVSSSPVNRSRKREISSVPSPSRQGMLRKQTLDDLNVNIVEKEVLKLSESTPDVKLENTASTLGMEIDASSDGYRSDDINEVENYVDASPAMEPEAETGIDEEPRGDSNTHEESEKLEAQCSASMSAGNSYPSDDDDNSFIEGRFSLSYSSPPSNLTKNSPVNGDGAAEVHKTLTIPLMPQHLYILDHDTNKKNSSQVVEPTKDTEDGNRKFIQMEGLKHSGSVILSTEASEFRNSRNCLMLAWMINWIIIVGVDCSEVENKPVVLSNGSACDLKEVAGAPLDFFSKTTKSDTSESASTEEPFVKLLLRKNGTCHDALGSPSEIMLMVHCVAEKTILNLRAATNDHITLRLSELESESQNNLLWVHLSNSTEGTMPSGSHSTDHVSEVTHHQPLANPEPMVLQDISTPEAKTLLHLLPKEVDNFQQDPLSGVEMEPISDLPSQHPEEMMDVEGGIRRTKIPPRSPPTWPALIEAVASHDKSRICDDCLACTLRKVTERALSYRSALKPAAVTRPS